MGPGGCQEPGRDQEDAVAALLEAEALAQAEALVRADQEGVTPQDLLALADRAVRMAGGMREHIVAGSLLDAWAAADWLGDLAQEVKDKLPVDSRDIIAAVEGNTLPPRPPAGGMGGRGVHVAETGTDAEERARSRDTGR